MRLQVINNEEQYEASLSEIDRLILLDPSPGTEDADRLAVLSVLVENYEKEHFPIEKPTPVEAVRFRMEEQGLSQRDLEPFIGSRSKVSEVLAERVPLSLRMIRALHENLGIPAEVLLQTKESLRDNEEIDWAKFPVREMWKRGWLEATRDDVKERSSELARRFFAESGFSVAPVFFRRAIHKRTASVDSYALFAWVARVLYLADRDEQIADVERTEITKEFLTDVVRLSSHADGPIRARDFLAQHGIALVAEAHLPKTKLDGAAMITRDGRRVIALTLRYDRLDNFWFTLMHELAHHALHVSSEKEAYVDDLDVEGAEDTQEIEADRFAGDAMIPRTVWRRSAAFRERTPEAITKLATQLEIHPAIIAGRIRNESRNFYRLNQMIGHRQVRVMFAERGLYREP